MVRAAKHPCAKKAPLEHVWYKTMFPAAVFFMRTTILLNLSDLGFYRLLHFQLQASFISRIFHVFAVGSRAAGIGVF